MTVPPPSIPPPQRSWSPARKKRLHPVVARVLSECSLPHKTMRNLIRAWRPSKSWSGARPPCGNSTKWPQRPEAEATTSPNDVTDRARRMRLRLRHVNPCGGERAPHPQQRRLPQALETPWPYRKDPVAINAYTPHNRGKPGQPAPQATPLSCAKSRHPALDTPVADKASSTSRFRGKTQALASHPRVVMVVPQPISARPTARAPWPGDAATHRAST